MRRSKYIFLTWGIVIFFTLLCNTALAQNTSKKDTVEFGEKPTNIERVRVTAKRKRYDRDSPAVRLVKELIKRREEFSPFAGNNYVNFQRYEKLVMSYDNFQGVDSTKALGFLNDHAVVNPYNGKTILPLSLREKIVFSQRGTKVPQAIDTMVYSTSQGVDDRFSQSTVLAFINELVPEIDFFGENIYLARRKFISPLSSNASSFYKYYLHGDTIVINGKKSVELEFYPFSKHSLALRGKFIVDVDSTTVGAPVIRKAEVSIPPSADINFVGDIFIEQTFERDSNGFLLPYSDVVNFDITPIKSVDALNITRTNIYSGFEYSDSPIEDKIYAQGGFIAPPDGFAASEKEKEVVKLTEQLRKKTLWKILEEGMWILTEGYLQTGKKSLFDIGPVENFLTGNTVEGTRISFGGMTTPNLSKHVFFDGVVGYGFDDKKLKYDLSLEWSFLPKKHIYKEFPVHSLRATYSYDIHDFSDDFDRINNRNVFTWATRTVDSKLTYVELYQLRYTKEWRNHMGLNLYVRNYTNFETTDFSFTSTAGLLPSYTMSEAELRFRFAPGEKIYQTRRTRRNLNLYSAEMELSHVSGFEDILGGDYSRNLTTFTALGRVNLQAFGSLDLYGNLGYEWSTVPYMLLPHPKTNLSYMNSMVSQFSLMMPLEFMYDKYAFVGINYNLEGLIFSRLPLINHLNLREVITFKGIYGSLSERNNPAMNPSLLPFPAGSSPLGTEPYIELGVGIDNILSLFRIDYVWRVTYLNNAPLGSGALLFDFQFKF